MNRPLHIAVFASGGGSNLQALLDRFNSAPGAPARVVLVVAGRPGIGALQRAERAGVPTLVLSPGALESAPETERLLRALEGAEVDLVVLAGFLRLVPAAVVERYRGRMINIHPALLPGFGGPGMYGIRVHRAVLESGARVTGATVHLVDEHYDRGAILGQWPVPVLPGDTPERLAARVLAVEHRLLPAVVEAMAFPDAAARGQRGESFVLAAEGPSERDLRSAISTPAGPHRPDLES